MWVFYLLLISAGCFLLAKIIPKGAPAPVEAIESVEDFDDEFEAEDGEEWTVYKFNPNRPQGDWVNLPGRSSRTNVAGTSFTNGAAARFLKTATKCNFNGRPFGVDLRRDDQNIRDPNAINVYGRDNSEEIRIGTLARDVSEYIAESFAQEMPIAAELIEAGDMDDAVFFKIAILVPPAKKRSKFILG